MARKVAPPKPGYVPKAAPVTRPRPAAPPPRPRPSAFRTWAKRAPLIALGGVVFAGGVYGSMMYKSLQLPPVQGIPDDVTDRYTRHNVARNYDSDFDRVEYWMGITRLRRKMAEQAEGHVLEVAAGTGRNTGFYNLRKCRSITLVERSGEMAEVARRKWEEVRREAGKDGREPRGEAMRIVQADALEGVPEAPKPVARVTEGTGIANADATANTSTSDEKPAVPVPATATATIPSETARPGYYDTIIQTMGLCSTPHPEKLLEKMGDAVSDNGRILLLEHGRAKWDWLNRILDRGAPAHADKHGCWWNKDIGALVARAEGLEVVEIKRKWAHGGTTWWVELRKTEDAVVKRKEAEVRAREEEKRRRDSLVKGEAVVAVAEFGDAAVKAVQGGKSWWQVWK